MVRYHLSKDITDASLILLGFLFLSFICGMSFLSFFSSITSHEGQSGASTPAGYPDASRRRRDPEDDDGIEAATLPRLYRDQDGMLSFGNTIQCEVACGGRDPCEYQLAADFRVIVLAYDEPEQLGNCLRSLEGIRMYGDAIVVDVWVDKLPGGRWNDAVLRTVSHFIGSWHLGYACVHVHDENVGSRSQWINSWRPQENVSQITLIVEDDVVLSPFVYKWLRNVWDNYVIREGFRLAGVSLNTNGLRRRTDKGTQLIRGPPGDSVYAYRAVAGGGAFAPNPVTWAAFQRWYGGLSLANRKLSIVVPGEPSTERRLQQTWQSWYNYYCYKHGLFTLCPNLVAFSGLLNVSLAHHVGEEGGTGIRKGVDGSAFVLNEWIESYGNLPTELVYLDYTGLVLPTA
ncbi:hypothetical protein LSH36_274g01041 [Paralvinella palmiformis]|uniref:Uncharacterized protein n=1 Tax=Paralvinella palmiformis TaxID=53620 RepID=A0AAD9JJJ0_9ANNE|nr:hypothetical protein LSH36_274g01041 [Paralvinella palmiformis]